MDKAGFIFYILILENLFLITTEFLERDLNDFKYWCCRVILLISLENFRISKFFVGELIILTDKEKVFCQSTKFYQYT